LLSSAPAATTAAYKDQIDDLRVSWLRPRVISGKYLDIGRRAATTATKNFVGPSLSE
jgi:hypothetical protein